MFVNVINEIVVVWFLLVLKILYTLGWSARTVRRTLVQACAQRLHPP